MESMSEQFKEWNKIFTKLRYRHETWYIFRDFLDLTIDNFTIPNQTPLFENTGKYTDKEYEYFGELFTVYIQTMNEQLQTKPYYDFLGEWWESDQNMTNKFNAQFFTPMNVCELMDTMVIATGEKEGRLTGEANVMYDCCCGSGRFGLVHQHHRPQDYYFMNDLDQYAVKMTILNMLFHGMQGVVAHMNTLTEEVFSCWRVTPFLFEFGGLPYVVPYGKDLKGALSFLPRGDVVTPSVETKMTDKQKNIGGLDKWL